MEVLCYSGTMTEISYSFRSLQTLAPILNLSVICCIIRMIGYNRSAANGSQMYSMYFAKRKTNTILLQSQSYKLFQFASTIIGWDNIQGLEVFAIYLCKITILFCIVGEHFSPVKNFRDVFLYSFRNTSSV